MSNKNKLLSSTIAAVIAVGTFSISTTTVRASDAGAFIGGVFATKLISNSRRRTNAEESQAYSAQQQVNQAPASSSSGSAEDRIAELDKLAAGGYITPAEYKTKKKAILDSM